jgi:hypothetical protein
MCKCTRVAKLPHCTAQPETPALRPLNYTLGVGHAGENSVRCNYQTFFYFFLLFQKKTKKLFASQKSFFSFFAFLFKKSRIKKMTLFRRR